MEQSTTSEMKTALFERHVSLNAKMIDFCGWKMPLCYKGIIPEHHAVRNHAGIFDISHMGRVAIVGKDAERFLDYLSTNLIEGKKDGSATYTVWCRANGMCVDDVLIYRQSPTEFFTIVNASNRQKDLFHLMEQARSFDVKIEDRFHEGILAVQGPKADALINRIFPEAEKIKPMHFQTVMFKGENVILSRTGYTGAGGFEIFGPNPSIINLWDLILQEGRDFEIQPIGLGARDTLRLEMGYALYGHELSEEIAASESVAAWTIKWSKKDFLGKEALNSLERSPSKRFESGLILSDKGVAREGYPVLKEGRIIGKVTSGSFSPSLNQSVAIALVSEALNPGEQIEIAIREHRVRAHAAKLPFWNH